MSEESNGSLWNKLAWLAAGAGVTYGYVCWSRQREHKQRRLAARQHAAEQQPAHAQPRQLAYQAPLQQQRPQFHQPPAPAPQVQNMLPQNPQVAPFSVPTPPPMQYQTPPPAPEMPMGGIYGNGSNSDSSGFQVELQGF